MRKRNLLLAVIGSLLLLQSIISFGTVSAMSLKSPEFEYWHEDVYEVAADCGNFQVIAEYSLDVSATIFFDKVGEPLRAQFQVLIDGQITNSVTGQTLRDKSHHTYFDHFYKGTFRGVGLEFAITVPGEGIAILDAGNLIWKDGQVVHQSGPHQFLEGGPGLFCAALD